MSYKQQHQSAPRPYRVPDIETVDGCTYNRWGALAVVYGLNVPFVSRLATNVRDEEGFPLWSSPRLVLTIAEAHDAYRNGNEPRQAELMNAALYFCNQYLPEGDKLADDTILRLTWVQYGICSISCEENRRGGYDMDVVKHGVNTFILNAPKNADDESDRRMQTEHMLTPTGTPFERPQRDERYKSDNRSPLNPNRQNHNNRNSGYGGKGGGRRNGVGY